MRRQPCIPTSLAFIVSLSLLGMATAHASGLAGWWKLDETSGTTAADASGNGNDGTLEGDGQWAEGVLGGAWEGDGTGDYIRIPHSDSLDLSEAVTVGLWLYGGIGPDQVICKGDDGAAWNSAYSIRMDDDSSHARQINWRGRVGSTDDALNSNTGLPAEEWTHLAVTFDVSAPGNNQKIYVNGTLDAESRSTIPLTTNSADVLLGADGYSTTRWHWQGKLDDVRLYSQALTASQIEGVMTGGGLEAASAPNPGNEEIDVLRDALLAWEAGDHGASHDVYLGTAFDDVNEASRNNPLDVLVSEGQAATTYDAGRLALGQTYYWRVDEVNTAPDNTIFRGEVWSFTTELVAYPLSGVTAATNAASQDGSGPEKMVDGSGLDANDQHSTESTDMWQAEVSNAESIQIDFAFDNVYCLHKILVWNSNTQFEWLLGLSLQNITVEYSEDGETWTVLGDVDLGQGTSAPDYEANTSIDFGGVAAQYVRFTVNSRYSDSTLFGLSEVRFLYIPVYASQPAPADGDADVSIDAVLAWRPGRQVVSHDVYLGTDPNALSLAGIVDDAGFIPDTLGLATTYYWRIDEVNDAETVGLWQGDLWSFVTQAYIVVDDFESYNDDDNLIYETWIDGWVNGTGSTVGYLEAPFAEMEIVHGGDQAMPLFYDNSKATSSEAEHALSQDWTSNGIQSLSLFFRGAADNEGGQLYVAINGSKIMYDGDSDDIASTLWLPWNIDLSTIGGNPSNVTSLIIGVEGDGVQGTLYIDDIRLYPQTPEVIVPTVPDKANLVAHFAFEGDFSNSAGNHATTVLGNPEIVNDATRGQVLSLDGNGDFIDVTYSADLNPEAFTASFWANPDVGSSGHRSPLAARDDPPQCGYLFYLTPANVWSFWVGKGSGWGSIGTSETELGEWAHIAGTGQNEQQKLYVNGVLVAEGAAPLVLNTQQPLRIGAGVSESETGNYFFPGQLDEVRIYDRILSDEEVAGLAGRTASLHKAF